MKTELIDEIIEQCDLAIEIEDLLTRDTLASHKLMALGTLARFEWPKLAKTVKKFILELEKRDQEK